MENIKLSIIIPYYNAKIYCDELLKNLDKQVNENVQVILIDDGSKEEYKPTYKWLEIYRKKNGGDSSARNLGLDKAKGEYISFIDSDDLVSDNYISSILTKIDTEDFDYCYLSWKSFGTWNVEIKLNSIEDEFPDYNLCCWNRVYRKSLIGEIKFNEKKAIAEDAEFIRDVQDNCKKKAFISDIMYYYRSDTPNSLTKRYSEGEINMRRFIYNYTHITKDMDYLLDEVKELNKKGEVIIMTQQNDIPELKRYAMVTKPINIKGTELRGEYTSLFTKITLPIKCQVAIWAGDIFAIGGMESFLYYFCSLMSKYYQIVVVYKYLDTEQRKRLEPYVQFASYTNKIDCDVLIANRMLDTAPTTITYKRKYQMIHCCKINELWRVGTDNDKILAVSNTVKESYKQDIGEHPVEIVNNLININKSQKALRLITASRLTFEKGGERMIQLAKLLNKNHIPFIWTIFSNDRLKEDIEGIVYMQPTLNITPYIASSDYLVQLSDSEAFGYSLVESLLLGVPVITTPLPVLEEIGVVDGKNAVIVPFDMQNIDINSITKKNYKFNYKYNNEKIIEQWKELIGEVSYYDSSFEEEKEEEFVILKVSVMYKDKQIGRVISPGEKLILRRTRAEQIQNAGFGEISKK